MVLIGVAFLALGFFSGIKCEEAVDKKEYGLGAFFGLCAVAGSISSSSIAIICFLAANQNASEELMKKILELL